MMTIMKQGKIPSSYRKKKELDAVFSMRKSRQKKHKNIQ